MNNVKNHLNETPDYAQETSVASDTIGIKNTATQCNYKNSEMGVIPSDWQCIQLTKIAKLESGHTPKKSKPDYWNGTIQWISLHDTDNLSANQIHTTVKTITQAGLDHSSARLLPAGTVVFSRTATVGKASIMAKPMATSQDFANYICGPDLHNLFLVYLFRGMKNVWRSHMAGSIHNTIYMPVFRTLKVALPTIQEQQNIATILSDTDALLIKLDQLIAKKRDIKQGAMQELLTGKRRLPGFTENWAIERLGECGEMIRGVTFNTDNDLLSCETHKSTRLLRANNIKDHSIDLSDIYFVNSQRVSNKQFLCDGDVIICMANGSRNLVGKSALYNKNDSNNYTFGAFTSCFRTTKKNISSRYISYIFQSHEYKKNIYNLLAGSSINNLKPLDIELMQFSIPNLQEQSVIVDILSQMEAEIFNLQLEQEKTRRIKHGMMQQLLTGKIRLV